MNNKKKNVKNRECIDKHFLFFIVESMNSLDEYILGGDILQIRLGYVAMSVNIKDCSPSKTVTVTVLDKVPEFTNKIKRLKKIAHENLLNTLRILRYNKANGIEVYRFSSKIFPLATYPGIEYTNYVNDLTDELLEIGNFVKENSMRVSLHPDHFVLLNSISKKVYQDSIRELMYQNDMFNRMGLDSKYKFVLHVGGVYASKKDSLKRFYTGFKNLPSNIKHRIILENDDKSYNATDVLKICTDLKIPMVFDVHHHYCNSDGNSVENILSDVFETWNNEYFPAKFHMSSPKSVKNIRGHADYINEKDFINFVDIAKGFNKDFDIMIEAKQKDEALKRIRNLIN